MLNAFTDEYKAKLLGIETGAQVNRNPSRLCTYLPVATPYTTPTLVAGTPTKIYPATTVKTIKDFTFDTPNLRYYLDDETSVNRLFLINASTSMASNSSNHLVSLELYKNGVMEEGVGIDRWIAAGADTGALALTGVVEFSHNDYIEVYITNTVSGTITLSRLSINIIEITE